jgi:hypothetical protein
MFWGTAGLVDEGAAVLGNTSISSQIQMLGDLAILLPKTLPSGVQNLLFSTLAMEATCKPVTDCQYSVSPPGTNIRYFLFCPSFTPPFAIQNEQTAIPMMNQFDPTDNTLIFESGTAEQPAIAVGVAGTFHDAGYMLNSTLNPAGVLVSLYYDVDPVQYAGVPNDQPGWYSIGITPIFYFYISACVLDVWDVTVSYSASTSGTIPSLTVTSPRNRSNFNTTSALLAALDSAYSGTLASHLATALEDSLNTSLLSASIPWAPTQCSRAQLAVTRWHRCVWRWRSPMDTPSLRPQSA